MTNRTMTRRDFGSKVITVSAAAAAASLAAPAVLGAAKARVVVIGGGAGGGTVARYVAKGSDDIAVTLINDSPTYSTCFFSNLYLGGFRSFELTMKAGWMAPSITSMGPDCVANTAPGFRSRNCSVAYPTSPAR